MFSGIAAVIGAIGTTAAITAPMMFAAIANVGMIASVVGAVTGDKDLQKIGAVAGMVGGVGGLATGAFSAAGTVADEAAKTLTYDAYDLQGAGDAVSAASASASAPAMDVMQNYGAKVDASQFGANTSVLDQTPLMNQQNTLPTFNSPAPPNPWGDPVAQANAFQPAPATPTLAPVAAPTPAPASGPTPSPAAAVTGSNSGGMVTGGVGNVDVSGIKDFNDLTMGYKPSTQFWSGISDFAKSNRDLLSTGLNASLGAASLVQKGNQVNQQMALAQQKQQWGNAVPSLAPRQSLIQSARG